VETVLELLPLPSAEDDDDLDWRVELAGRYGTVRPFADMLASVIPWGATAAGRGDDGDRAAATRPHRRRAGR
jgi:hypothetical protein